MADAADKETAPGQAAVPVPAANTTVTAKTEVDRADKTATPADVPETAALLTDEPSTPLQELWLAANKHAHKEIWGVTLADPATHIPSQIIFQKYLNANEGDVIKAKEQLTETLDWRAEIKPLELVKSHFSKVKFDGLGYVTEHAAATGASSDPESKEVFTWNIYGAVKDMDETFGHLQEFIQWRVALMELAVHALNIPAATKAITTNFDPYKIFQVHDYKTISFFRPPPLVRKASTATIKVLALAYPELLKEKFFINVPALMGFMYGLMKMFVAAKTIKKFHPMSNGGALALEFGESKVSGLGEMLPKEYGGKGDDLAVQGRETKLA